MHQQTPITNPKSNHAEPTFAFMRLLASAIVAQLKTHSDLPARNEASIRRCDLELAGNDNPERYAVKPANDRK
jgi:hypothetical protein